MNSNPQEIHPDPSIVTVRMNDRPSRVKPCCEVYERTISERAGSDNERMIFVEAEYGSVLNK